MSPIIASEYIIKYIFIIYLFGVIDIVILSHKVGSVQDILT
jgi:hypothetical protein